jgi:NAD-dependent deacetylase
VNSSVPSPFFLVLAASCSSRARASTRSRGSPFEELLPHEKSALLDHEVRRGFDVVFSIGTSSLFPYITAPVLMASARGGATVEINPGRTPLSDAVNVRLAMGAVAACEALWAARDRWRHT